MKNLLVLICVVLIISPAAFAQAGTSDIYQMGARRVTIPAADGFVEISSQFPAVTARMRATEDPGNDLLGLHVPQKFVPKLKISEDIDLEFYTKVSVSKRVRGVDITPALYAGVVAEMEKNFGTYIAADGPLMKKAEKDSGKGLTELLGTETTVSINAVKNLGFIDKSDKVFSGLLLMNLEVYGRKLSVLGTLSLLNINRRLIFVYTYKQSPAGNDIRELSAFTKKWTAKIIAANK